MAAEPAARWGHFSAPVDGQVYVYGGRTKDFSKDKSELTSTLSIFDSYSESWREVRTEGHPPAGVYVGASVGVGPHIYIYGGTDGSRFRVPSISSILLL